jgi:type IV pilus assembly protein PilB
MDSIKKKDGIICLSGPVSSGKTSSLYSLLKLVDANKKSVYTIEDPVEIKRDGLTQINIDSKSGLTFEVATRALLRADPDVILIGEIRDSETAELAIREAQTGHLVLTTLHSRSAIEVVPRLKNLGVPSYLIASTLISTSSQRLIPKLCDKCKKTKKISASQKSLFDKYSLDPPKNICIISNSGCGNCNNTGYKSRVVIDETYQITGRIKKLIEQDASVEELRSEFIKNNMKNTIVYNGLQAVKSGVIEFDDLLAYIPNDSFAMERIN